MIYQHNKNKKKNYETMGQFSSKYVSGVLFDKRFNLHSYSKLFKLNQTIEINKYKLKKNTILQLFEYNTYGFQDIYHKSYTIIKKINNNNIESSTKWFCIHNNYVNKI